MKRYGLKHLLGKCQRLRFIYIGVMLAALCVAAIYSWRLNFPPEPYYDEEHYVQFLTRLIHGHTYTYVSPHPLLWHLLTCGCMVCFGELPSVWRSVSLLAGLMLILWVYLLAEQISRDPPTAFFAAFIFSFDCISLTQARIGMLNSLALLFMIMSLWAFLRYWLTQQWPRKAALCSSGIFLGLALSTRLTSLSMLPMIGFLVMLRWIKHPPERKALFWEGIFFLVFLPALIYFATYAFIPFLPGQTWRDVWKIQEFNFHYHFRVANTQAHPYASQWWGWPLLLRPIWYYFTGQKGIVNGIICIGNPLVFWAIPIMFLYHAWNLARHKVRASGLILWGFCLQWLLYAFISRVKFFHYFYFAMPFVAIGLALMYKRIWDQGRAGQIAVCICLALILGMFLYWYPLLTGLPISEKYFQHHMWFRPWI
jgi:dolichyl-phosphate-mannose--protein O-mannosyl transferase